MKQTMPSERRHAAGTSNGSVAVESQFKNRMPPGHSFPARMPLGQFLFAYLYRCGVRHSFGVPGDFALPTFAWLEKSKIESVTMTHEPGAGFAADAYSRVNGIGLVCVTYCVGGLNVLNAIAGAYAEKSPSRSGERRAGPEGSRKRSVAASQSEDLRNAAPRL